MIPAHMLDILAAPNLAHVATIGPDGAPHNGPVWFEWDGTHIRFSQTWQKRRTRNLLNDPRASISIVDRNDPYRYLELRGTVTFADDHHRAFVDAMARRYLGVDRYPWATPGETFLVASLTPTDVRGIPAPAEGRPPEARSNAGQ